MSLLTYLNTFFINHKIGIMKLYKEKEDESNSTKITLLYFYTL